MWTRTRMSELFGLDFPIVQGPFGGGNSTVQLSALVSNLGALGSYGAVDLEPAELARTVRELEEQTGRPFAVNLWVPIPGQEEGAVPDADVERARERLRPHYAELGLEPPTRLAALPSFERQVEALLEARPPVFSFTMGVPDAAILREAKRRGIRTLGTATTVDEALRLTQAGVDAVVASGSDAGGHRGAFLRPVEQSLVGTFSLLPQIVSAVSVPVIAAGGIADGRGNRGGPGARG